MKYAVHMTPTADEEIYQQYRHIAIDQGSSQNAEAWWGHIYEAIDGLDEMPNRCPIAEENEHEDYEVRKQGVDGFNLLFTVFEDKKETWIIATRGRGMEVNPEQLPEDVRAVADELRGAENQRDEGQEPGQGKKWSESKSGAGGSRLQVAEAFPECLCWKMIPGGKSKWHAGSKWEWKT